jgi:hypothetical protein
VNQTRSQFVSVRFAAVSIYSTGRVQVAVTCVDTLICRSSRSCRRITLPPHPLRLKPRGERDDEACGKSCEIRVVTTNNPHELDRGTRPEAQREVRCHYGREQGVQISCAQPRATPRIDRLDTALHRTLARGHAVQQISDCAWACERLGDRARDRWILTGIATFNELPRVRQSPSPSPEATYQPFNTPPKLAEALGFAGTFHDVKVPLMPT